MIQPYRQLYNLKTVIRKGNNLTWQTKLCSPELGKFLFMPSLIMLCPHVYQCTPSLRSVMGSDSNPTGKPPSFCLSPYKLLSTLLPQASQFLPTGSRPHMNVQILLPTLPPFQIPHSWRQRQHKNKPFSLSAWSLLHLENSGAGWSDRHKDIWVTLFADGLLWLSELILLRAQYAERENSTTKSAS